MDSSRLPVSIAASPGLRDRALGIVATASLLAMLYFARDVLVPITLAFILSLLIAPLVRRLRHYGFGQTWSVMAAVLLLAICFGAFATVIGSQLVRMADSLPQYEQTIQTAFQEVSDGLAARGTYDDQLAALQRFKDAQQRRLELATARYRQGEDSYLNVLLAQQDLYGVQQSRLQAEFNSLSSRISLYQALGGGWK